MLDPVTSYFSREVLLLYSTPFDDISHNNVSSSVLDLLPGDSCATLGFAFLACFSSSSPASCPLGAGGFSPVCPAPAGAGGAERIMASNGPSVRPSYLAAAAGGGPGLYGASSFPAVERTPPPKVLVSFEEVDGFPAVIISDDDMKVLARPFELTLIGRFLANRPPVDVIRAFIVKLRFFGRVCVDPFDKRTAVFRFSDERDYIRFFARRLFKVFGMEMRVGKWSPFASISEELPIVPLWITFPGLRYQLFNVDTLMDLARVFGKPLCVGHSSASLGCMTCARVLVEVDTSVLHPEQIWIGSRASGAFQRVIIEELIPSCANCKECGHVSINCPVERGGVPAAASTPRSAPLPGPKACAYVVGSRLTPVLPVPPLVVAVPGRDVPSLSFSGGGTCNPPAASLLPSPAPVLRVLAPSAPSVPITSADGGGASAYSPVLRPASPGSGPLGGVGDGVESDCSVESIVLERVGDPGGRILPQSFRKVIPGVLGVEVLNPCARGFPLQGISTRAMTKARAAAASHSSSGGGKVSGGGRKHKNKQKKNRSNNGYDNCGDLAKAFGALFKTPEYSK